MFSRLYAEISLELTDMHRSPHDLLNKSQSLYQEVGKSLLWI